jgi:outer membrane immunogenic protein
MKTFWLGTIALVALVAPASAADLASRVYNKAPAPVLSPAYNWSGFYAGINLGGTFGNREGIDSVGQAGPNIANIAGGARLGSVDLKREGFIGGGQFGFNYKVASPWVVGLEADIAFTDIDERRNFVTVPLTGIGTQDNTFQTKMDYFGTVRGRVGYAWDRTLVYATGGLAYARIDNNATFFGPAGQVQFIGGQRDTKTGYAVGAGIEHAWLSNWTVRAEYLFYDLGDNTVGINVVSGSGGGGTGYNTTFHNDGHIVRAGLNYKFGPGIWGGL